MQATVEELISFAAKAAQSGLLASTCGNASLRLDDERILITATGTSLEALGREDVAVVRLADGAHLEGGRPSIELDLHRRTYLARPRVGAVLHSQSLAATTLCCAVDPPRDLDFIPEVPAYVGAHAYAEWAMPGSEALADAVARALEDPQVTIVQLTNHGQVIAASTWQRAIRRGLFFEAACAMALNGIPLRTIPEPDATTLRNLTRDI